MARCRLLEVGMGSHPGGGSNILEEVEMPTSDFNVVHVKGAKALCRFMYSEHGFGVPTMYHGGPGVNYREIASAL